MIGKSMPMELNCFMVYNSLAQINTDRQSLLKWSSVGMGRLFFMTPVDQSPMQAALGSSSDLGREPSVQLGKRRRELVSESSQQRRE